jgi:hypothetical protein
VSCWLSAFVSSEWWSHAELIWFRDEKRVQMLKIIQAKKASSSRFSRQYWLSLFQYPKSWVNSNKRHSATSRSRDKSWTKRRCGNSVLYAGASSDAEKWSLHCTVTKNTSSILYASPSGLKRDTILVHFVDCQFPTFETAWTSFLKWLRCRKSRWETDSGLSFRLKGLKS